MRNGANNETDVRRLFYCKENKSVTRGESYKKLARRESIPRARAAIASRCEISRTITHNHMQSIRESGLISAVANDTRHLCFSGDSKSRFEEARTDIHRQTHAREPTLIHRPRLAHFAEAIKNFSVSFVRAHLTFTFWLARGTVCRLMFTGYGP